MMLSNFVNLVRKHRDTKEVSDAIDMFGLLEEMDDPPFRRYLISREKGIDFLFENNYLVAVQIFVHATKNFSAFSETLPFGLIHGMRQSDIHRVLGAPASFDGFDSKYYLSEITLIISYDDTLEMKYVSIESAQCGPD